jgi:hypothetical protein
MVRPPSVRAEGHGYLGKTGAGGSIVPMAEQTPTIPLDQQLQEIGAQLAWVRDYL